MQAKLTGDPILRQQQSAGFHTILWFQHVYSLYVRNKKYVYIKKYEHSSFSYDDDEVDDDDEDENRNKLFIPT